LKQDGARDGMIADWSGSGKEKTEGVEEAEVLWPGNDACRRVKVVNLRCQDNRQ